MLSTDMEELHLIMSSLNRSSSILHLAFRQEVPNNSETRRRGFPLCADQQLWKNYLSTLEHYVLLLTTGDLGKTILDSSQSVVSMLWETIKITFYFNVKCLLNFPQICFVADHFVPRLLFIEKLELQHGFSTAFFNPHFLSKGSKKIETTRVGDFITLFMGFVHS